MAGNLNAAAIMQSWQSGFTASGKAYQDGVAGVTESPMAKAATPQAMADYKQGCIDAVDSGRRQAGLSRGSLQSWQEACRTTGASRLTSGAAKGAAKYAAWLNSGGLQAMQQAKADAAAVVGPKGDEATGLARVAAAMRAMKASKKNR